MLESIILLLNISDLSRVNSYGFLNKLIFKQYIYFALNVFLLENRLICGNSACALITT